MENNEPKNLKHRLSKKLLEPVNLKSATYWLFLFGLIVFIFFNLGSWIYVKSILYGPGNVKLRNFSALISNATQKDFTIKINDNTVTIKKEDLQAWAEPYVRNYNGQKDIRFASEKINEYLMSLAPSINIEPVDAKFEFDNGRAQVFVEPVTGKRLNIEKSGHAITQAMINSESSASLVIDAIEPEITLDKVNDLGINVLLSRGESNFAGSPAGRIKNIKIASSKYNGLILKPSQSFSFNEVLGEVDGTGGYIPEKVIKNHKLVYEYGGGICQVSTTLFRAAILAGFPITERHPHAFPVQYYNPQGFDATIYPGVSDLQFINDTPNHVLLQTKIIGTKLIFEMYGSDDGRKVTIDGPHQYDKKSDGSLKAYFTRTINYSDREKVDQKFYSNYRSPALYPLQKNPLE